LLPERKRHDARAVPERPNISVSHLFVNTYDFSKVSRIELTAGVAGIILTTGGSNRYQREVSSK
jgi:hypothetical protein